MNSLRFHFVHLRKQEWRRSQNAYFNTQKKRISPAGLSNPGVSIENVGQNHSTQELQEIKKSDKIL